MSKPFVIGFSGKAGSGKNTAASLLAQYFTNAGYTVFMDSFAYGIKKFMREEMGWDGKDKSEFWRKFMTMYGEYQCNEAHIGSNPDGDWWVQQLCERYMLLGGCGSPVDVYMITDCRKPIEAKFINWYGCLVRVEGETVLQRDAAANPTEHMLDGYQYENEYKIDNVGTKEELEEQIARLFGTLQEEMNGR